MAAAVPLYPYKARLPAPIYYLYRAIRTCGVAFCFALFWGGAVLIAWTWLPFLLLSRKPRPEKMRRILLTVRHGFQFFHWTMRVLRLYDRRCTQPTLRPGGAPRTGAAVLVANHPTLCDVTSIMSMFPDVVCLARPTLANHPMVKPLVRACGLVPAGLHMMKECEDRLAMGFDVVIFPEGTRSPVGGLHAFHRGAFELAARAKVPLVLLKLTCEPSALSKRLPIWKIADTKAWLTVEPFDMIAPEHIKSRKLCPATEQRYRDLLGYGSPSSETFSERPGKTA